MGIQNAVDPNAADPPDAAAPPSAADQSGWAALFFDAFRQSRNAMVLLDDQRRHVDANGAWLQLLGYRKNSLIGRPIYELIVGGPIASSTEWRAALRRKQFTGTADLICADGGRVSVEFAGHPEVVTGRQLVLFVALRTARGGRKLTQSKPASVGPESLSGRELEVIRLLAMGLNGPEIADELQIAHNTVRAHVRHAMEKVDARSRAQLVAKTLGEALYWRTAG